MNMSLSISVLTAVHVAISLLAMVSGLITVAGLVRNHRSEPWTAIFLATTIATSVTGFFFHANAIGPPQIIGGLSLAILGLAAWALYGRKLDGAWRSAYVVCAIAALYLNVFVGIVQAFQKIGLLHKLAPTGSEPSFFVAQFLALFAFVVLGVRAVQRFRNAGHASGPVWDAEVRD
jgi:hypothetical protein